MSEIAANVDFCIQTRPEIRKGCVWDVSLLFSAAALHHHKLKEIYLEKPRVQRESGAYLCLKVRSKLIQKEIGFGKVAELEHDAPYIEPNPITGAAVLKVKFTQRPRAVFHKHADVMVLVVSLRSCHSNEILLSAEHELIFRGGTGSMHSADSRKKQSSPQPFQNDFHLSNPRQDISQTQYDHSSTLNMNRYPSANPVKPPISTILQTTRSHSSPYNLKPSTPSQNNRDKYINNQCLRTIGTAVKQENNLTQTTNNQLHNPLAIQLPIIQAPIKTDHISSHSTSSDDDEEQDLLGLGGVNFGENHMEVQPLTLETIQEFQLGLQEHQSSLNPRYTIGSTNDDFNFVSSALCSSNGNNEDSSMSDFDDTKELEAWAKSYGVDTSLLNPSNEMNLSNYTNDLMPSSILNDQSSRTIQAPLYQDNTPDFTTSQKESDEVTFGHETQTLTDSNTELPGAMTRSRSARIQSDVPVSKKRKYSGDVEDGPMMKIHKSSESYCQNQTSMSDILTPSATGSHSFEDKVFQKLFFRSLAFLNLEELKALAQTAPLPIFVKDENGSYLIANSAFCSFVYDESWDAIANRSADQLLEKDESDKITRADAYIMAREGNIGTFYLSVKHQDYKVMKLFTKLRDGDQKVVVGAVVTF